MNIIKSVFQKEVLAHWFEVERAWPVERLKWYTRSVFDIWQRDISGRMPENTVWYDAEIGEEEIFVISSRDWRIASRDFRVQSIVDRLGVFSGEFYSFVHRCKIRDKITFLESGGSFKSRLIAVGDSQAGPFTLIDGNHRAAALAYLGKLSGTPAYIGISEAMKDFWWARFTYAGSVNSPQSD